jgi:hypothetical protein
MMLVCARLKCSNTDFIWYNVSVDHRRGRSATNLPTNDDISAVMVEEIGTSMVERDRVEFQMLHRPRRQAMIVWTFAKEYRRGKET